MGAILALSELRDTECIKFESLDGWRSSEKFKQNSFRASNGDEQSVDGLRQC